MPRLYERGTGILETHITLEDIEQVLFEHFNEKVKFSSNTKVSRIGKGDGYNSIVALIEPEWVGECPSKIPGKFVAKIAANHDPDEFLELALKSENKSFEQFYDDAEATFRTEQEKEQLFFELYDKYKWDIQVPDFYGRREFSPTNLTKCCVLLEAVDGFTIDRYDKFSIEEAKQVVRKLAKFHMGITDLTTEDKDKLSATALDCYLEFCSEVPVTKMLRKWDYDPTIKALLDQVIPMFPKIYSIPGLSLECKRLGIDPVLIHSDIWSTNMLFENGDTHRKLKCFLDFQFVHIGAPSIDLTMFTSSCMDGNDRQEHWLELMHCYYEELKNVVGGGKMPFTFDQLLNSYRQIFPTIALIMMDLFKDPTNEKAKEVGRERVRAVLEEILVMTKDI